jgi:hypothetical protein
VDVARASHQIDALIDKRVAGREEAPAEEMLWKSSVRRHNEKLRRGRRGEWYCYFSALASSLRKRAEEYEAKAGALLVEEGGGDAP